MAPPFGRTVFEPERLIASGEHVVALLGVRRRLPDTAAEIDLRVAYLWTIREGKAVRGQAFAERELGVRCRRLAASEDLDD